MCGEGRRSEGSREKLWVLEDPRNGLVERDEEAMDHSLTTQRETERERERWLVNLVTYMNRKSLFTCL